MKYTVHESSITERVAAERECRWTWQRLELWTTACQREFRFDMDDVPDEESIAFCPYCGGRIVFDAAALETAERECRWKVKEPNLYDTPGIAEYETSCGEVVYWEYDLERRCCRCGGKIVVDDAAHAAGEGTNDET